MGQAKCLPLGVCYFSDQITAARCALLFSAGSKGLLRDRCCAQKSLCRTSQQGAQSHSALVPMSNSVASKPVPQSSQVLLIIFTVVNLPADSMILLLRIVPFLPSVCGV